MLVKLFGLLLLVAAAFAQSKTGDVTNGKKLFVKNGCYQCHGHVGQGGLAGPRLSQTRHTQASFVAFVRNPPPGGMPSYRAKIMSDQELADVFAYIKTFPEPAPAKSIPLLAN